MHFSVALVIHCPRSVGFLNMQLFRQYSRRFDLISPNYEAVSPGAPFSKNNQSELILLVKIKQIHIVITQWNIGLIYTAK